MNTLIKLSTAVATSLLAISSYAQQATDSTTVSTANTAQSENLSTETSHVHKVIGFGALLVPEYPGAKKNRVLPALFADVQYDNGFFVSSTRGIGYSKKVDATNFSAALGYRGGRNDNRDSKSLISSDDLKGMGDISGSVTANLQASTTLGGMVTASISTNLALSHRENGNQVQFALAAPLYQSKSDQVDLSGSLSYADAKYNQTQFGVTNAQSSASGYRAFTAKAGFNQASASVTWTHVIDRHWSVRSGLGVSHLIGDAANSPLTKKKTNPLLISTVNYSF